MRAALLLAVLAMLWPLLRCASPAAAATPTFPALSGRIVDEAGLLSAADRAEIATLLRELEGKSSDQIVVVTLKSLQGLEIEDYGYQLGRHWGIGQKGVDNGILLIVAPAERKVRIEVGRGLEPQMTDFMSKLIVDNAVLPGFRRGDFPGGIKAGTRDIKDVLLGDAEAVRQRAKAGKKRSGNDFDVTALVFFLIWLAVVVMIMRAQMRSDWQSPQQGANYRRDPRDHHRGSGPVVIPGGWGGSGTWGGSGGSSSPDSGWSGGGGDFGGGGASGSW